MDIKAIQSTVEILEQAVLFSLESWQKSQRPSRFYKGYYLDKPPVVHSVKEANECNTTACIAGYTAMTDDFLVKGGSIDLCDGSPVISAKYRGEDITLDGGEAMAYFWDVPNDVAVEICGAGFSYPFLAVFNKNLKDVTKEDAILKLKEMVAVGLFLEALTLDSFNREDY